MILLSIPLKFDPWGNMVGIFFHGVVIVATRIVSATSLRKICHQLLSTMNVLKFIFGTNILCDNMYQCYHGNKQTVQ